MTADRTGKRVLWAVGVLIAAVAPGIGQVFNTDAAVQSKHVQAKPFELSQVKLLDGPFKHASEVDAAYLLSLEPDRLLSWVYKSAGLEPKAPVYGGWESETIATHSLGHYLSACAMHFAATGDKRFRERVVYIVSEMAKCQQADGDGYVAGIPRGKEIFAEVTAGDIRSKGFDLNGCWVPWYTMHKLLAGLRDVYVLCEVVQAREVMLKLADYCWDVVDNLNDEQMQKMLACEHGGMNEVAADLYALTGEQRYLQMAEKFYHTFVLEPLANEQDRLAGLHANTQVPKIIGAARLFELTSKPRYETIAKFFWDRVVRHYSYVNGGNSYYESFGQPDKQVGTLHDTTETCNSYNMLKLTRHLFMWQPDAELMDFYERVLLNHILAHQHPETGMFVYKGFLDAGARKHFSTPFDSFWCCVGTGMENHVKYGESIYFHDADTLYVNLFIHSQLAWQQRGLTLTQETAWPYDDQVTLKLALKQPQAFKLNVRVPYWVADQVTVSINGEVQAASAKPGSYLTLQRTWQDGDVVSLKYPMTLRFESMPDDKTKLAAFYGPTLLAAVHDDTTDMPPALVGPDDVLLKRIQPVDLKSLRFTTQAIGRPSELTLMPLFKIVDQRYSVYLDHFSPAEWQELLAQREEQRRQLALLDARTLDHFLPGQMQMERDHNFKGEQIRNGRHANRTWRDAHDGGWFSFEMVVDPDEAMTLRCTYWGDDAGARTFDILVEGEKLTTQTLNRLKPGDFVDVDYPLTAALTKDKQRITVRLQAHPGNVAGGLFGCRTLRREPAEQ